MASLSIECLSCLEVYVTVTTCAEGAADALRCPLCGSPDLRRLVGGFAAVAMIDSKNMSPLEIEAHLAHKRDLERGLSVGRYEIRERGPREFRPAFAKRCH